MLHKNIVKVIEVNKSDLPEEKKLVIIIQTLKQVNVKLNSIIK
jgi:hypothetical protein